MTLRDLLKYGEKYAKEYPQMLDNDVIVSIPRGRAYKGEYYKKHKITSIGFNVLVAKDSLDLGIEQIS